MNREDSETYPELVAMPKIFTHNILALRILILRKMFDCFCIFLTFLEN